LVQPLFPSDNFSPVIVNGTPTFLNGKLYGSVPQNSGSGARLFEFDLATNVLSDKLRLGFASLGKSPAGGFTWVGGKAYGLTSEGGNTDQGTIFEWDPATNHFAKKHDFLNDLSTYNPEFMQGAKPVGNLVAYNGKLYGATREGGFGGFGTLFDFDPATSQFTFRKHMINDAPLSSPVAGLTQLGGMLYGMANDLQNGGSGALFLWDPVADTVATKATFTAESGSDGKGQLAVFNGKLYGMHDGGSNGFGAIFEYDPATNTYTKKYDFTGGANGGSPQGGLLLVGNKFYGAAGGIFEWDPVTNVYSFKGQTTANGDLTEASGVLFIANGSQVQGWEISTETLYTLPASASFPWSAGREVSVLPFVQWNGNAWRPAAPIATDPVVVLGNANPPPSFAASNLTVQSVTNLTIASGTTATVNGVLSYLGNLTVQSGGALVQAVGSTLGTTTGTFTAQRGIAAKVGPGYNMIAAPVAGATFNAIGTTPFPASRFRHAPANASGSRWVPVAGPDNLAAGIGYTFVSPTGTSTLNFVGTPGNGPISVPLTGQNTYRFNLVGNPYPSPLRLSALFGANPGPAGIDGTAWFWRDNNNNTGTGSYLAINNVSGPDAQAAVGQGFFVQANGNSGTLNFTNAMREGGDPTFYRGEESMERFRLAVSTSGGQDELWVAFGPQFTTGFEKGYDAEKLEGASNLSLSAVVGGGRLAIAALPEPGSQRFELPLQFFARNAGAYTFAAGEVESPTAQKLFLEDRQTGELYYLQPGRSHTLGLAAGTHRDRFYLRASSEVAGRAGQTAGAYSFGRDLFVEAAETAEVVVVSAMGREIQRFAGVEPGGLRRLAVGVPASGVYVVRVATASATVEKRVWLEK
jgi:uncharacterized repeat protein (TIGR03803 family)